MTGSTPYSEPEGTAERISQSFPMTEPTYLIEAEPLPDWDEAKETWKWVWDLHWGGLGSLFALLALYALWSLFDLAGKKHRRKPLLAITISSLLLIFGLTRALFLFINPYESEQCFLPFTDCPVMLSRVLFSIALPCITASFFLLHLTFLQLSKLKLYPEKLQSVKFVTCVVAFHFTLASVTVVVTSLSSDWIGFTIVCETFFILLSLVLSTSFIYSGRIILKSVKESRFSVRRFMDQKTAHAHSSNPNVTKLVKITYITVFLGFASVGLQLYSIFVVHGMYSKDHSVTPEPWPWLIFESLCRLVELGLGCTMAYVNPRQVPRLKRRRRWEIFLKRFKRGGWSTYAQNQSSVDSSDVTSPVGGPYGKYLPTMDLGLVNQGGSFVIQEEFLQPTQPVFQTSWFIYGD